MAEYDRQLKEDLKKFKPAEETVLQAMLAFDPKQRKSLQELQFPVTPQEIEAFWQKLNS
jgi:hypothetical protein